MALIASDARIMGAYRLGKIGQALLWALVGVVTVLTLALFGMQLLGVA